MEEPGVKTEKYLLSLGAGNCIRKRRMEKLSQSKCNGLSVSNTLIAAAQRRDSQG
jgi:hypothetical protein